MDDTKAWALIHNERAAMADTLAELTPSQWAQPSLCGGWSVHVTAAHIVLGAEQTRSHFLARMAANGFRFNTMIDRDARRAGDGTHRRDHRAPAGQGDDDQPAAGTGADDAGRDRRARRRHPTSAGAAQRRRHRGRRRLPGDVQGRQLPGGHQEADRRPSPRGDGCRLVTRRRPGSDRDRVVAAGGDDRSGSRIERPRRRWADSDATTNGADPSTDRSAACAIVHTLRT